MDTIDGFKLASTKDSAIRVGLGRVLLGALFMSLFALTTRLSFCQAVESANAGGVSGWGGASVSEFHFKYGEMNATGISGFVDIDTIRHLGVEAEARWLCCHGAASMQAETYLLGPRYHFNVRKFQLYTKGLVGEGEFSFPYHYAHGHYIVIAGGGGVDYQLSHRVSLRAGDFEYQYWPGFTFGSMSSIGISMGIRYRVR